MYFTILYICSEHKHTHAHAWLWYALLHAYKGFWLFNVSFKSEGTVIFVAKEWSVTHSSDTTTFSISDDITKLIDEHGPGVYTVLLWTTPTGSGNTIVITTISIFV